MEDGAGAAVWGGCSWEFLALSSSVGVEAVSAGGRGRAFGRALAFGSGFCSVFGFAFGPGFGLLFFIFVFIFYITYWIVVATVRGKGWKYLANFIRIRSYILMVAGVVSQPAAYQIF